MSYRLNTQVKPLFWIEPVVERYSHSRVEYMIKAKSQFKKRSTANNVEIVIPVPSDVDGPKFKTTTGYCKYVPEKCAIVWTIKSFPGGKEFLMRGHFNLPSVESEEIEGKPPIQVRFEIPYFTTSGIQVFDVTILSYYICFSFLIGFVFLFRYAIWKSLKRADIKRCRGLDTLLKMAIIRLECLSFIGLFFKIIYLTILFIHTVFYFKLYLKINKNDRDVFFYFFWFSRSLLSKFPYVFNFLFQ